MRLSLWLLTSLPKPSGTKLFLLPFFLLSLSLFVSFDCLFPLFRIGLHCSLCLFGLFDCLLPDEIVELDDAELGIRAFFFFEPLEIYIYILAM